MIKSRDEMAAEEVVLLERLAACGYRFASVSALRESGSPYPEAVDVLLDALSRTTDRKLKSGIVRALSVPWARPAATLPLIRQFREVDDESGLGLRWTIGNALEVVRDDEYFDELAALAEDQTYGRAREMIVLGLARSSQATAGTVLVRLLDDPVVGGHAVRAIRKFNRPDARAGLERKLSDDRPWVRRDARKALDASAAVGSLPAAAPEESGS